MKLVSSFVLRILLQSNSMSNDSVSQFLSVTSPGNIQFGDTRMALLDIESGFWGIRRQIEALIGTQLAGSVIQQAGANGGASFAKSFAGQTGVSTSTAFTACINAYQTAGFGKFEILKMDWPLGRIQIRANNAFEAWMYQRHHQQTNLPVCDYTSGVFVGFINILGSRQDVVCIEHTCQARGDESCLFELLPVSQAKGQPVVGLNPEPGLGRQINLLEMLFERMPMGIAVLDCQFHIQRYNPTWGDFAERYAPPSGVPLAPGIHYFDHLPGTENTVGPLFERALLGETVRENSVRLESDGVVTFWDIVLAPLEEQDEIVGILNVAVDVTERVEAQQNLEQRVKERTRQLQTLLDVASTANSSLNLEEILTKTLDLLVGLIGASRAGVSLLDEGSGQLQASILRPGRKVDPPEMAKILQAGQAVIESGNIMYIAPDESQGFRKPVALLPIQTRGRMLGVLGLIGNKGSEFDAEQLALFKSIADQLGIAIENSHLFEQVEVSAVVAERNRLARDLHDAVTQTLFSASMIADVLPKIWDRNPEDGRLRLEELRQLTRGALSEMRTLLVELRPAALVDTDLGELIGHQVNAFIARTRISVEYERQCTYNPPPAIKEVFYRVIQEAFNNISKHAEATLVSIKVSCLPERVELHIQDNGIGFNPQQTSHSGLGLNISKERARSVDAKLEIQSQLQHGTHLRMIWHSTSQEKIDQND